MYNIKLTKDEEVIWGEDDLVDFLSQYGQVTIVTEGVLKDYILLHKYNKEFHTDSCVFILKNGITFFRNKYGRYIEAPLVDLIQKYREEEDEEESNNDDWQDTHFS